MKSSQKERCVYEQCDGNRSHKFLPRVNVYALEEIDLRLAFIEVGEENEKSDNEEDEKDFDFDFGGFGDGTGLILGFFDVGVNSFD